MKFDWRVALELWCWILLAVVVGWQMLSHVGIFASISAMPLAGWQIILFVCIGVAIGTTLTLYWERLVKWLFRRAPSWVRWCVEWFAALAFILIVGNAVFRGVLLLIGQNIVGMPALLFSLSLGSLFAIVVVMLAKENIGRFGPVRYWYRLSNSLMLLLFCMAGVTLGFNLSLWVMVVLLCAFALYDAYAVWKSKHMIVVAQKMVSQGFVAGFAVERRGKKFPALLGGGDVFIIVLVMSSMSRFVSSFDALFAVLGMLSGLAYILFFGKRNKFYPAVPFMAAGFAVAVGVLGFCALAGW